MLKIKLFSGSHIEGPFNVSEPNTEPKSWDENKKENLDEIEELTLGVAKPTTVIVNGLNVTIDFSLAQ